MSSTTPTAVSTSPAAETKREFAASGKPFFENLDAMRYLGFVAVFFFHVHLYEYISGLTQNPVLLSLVRVISSGGWGLTMFFALSGFLITWLLLLEKRKKGRVNIPAFYMRRVLRIWPLYAFVIVTGLVVLPYLYRAMNQPLYFDYQVWLYATFLSNFGVMALDPAFAGVRSFPLILNVTWSVSVEEQYYLVWPLFFVLKERLLHYAPLFLMLVSVCAAMTYTDDYKGMYHSSFTRIGEIAIGAGFAILAFRREKVMNFFRNVPRALTAAVYILAYFIVDISFRFQLSPLGEYWIHMSGAVLFSVIIMEQNFSRNSFFKLSKLRVSSFLGKISYGLYMLHPIAMFAASALLQRMLHSASPVSEGPLFMTAAFILTLLFAVASYYLFERPFLKLKDRFSFEKKKKLVVSVPAR